VPVGQNPARIKGRRNPRQKRAELSIPALDRKHHFERHGGGDRLFPTV
jgi:hypothetical protein